MITYKNSNRHILLLNKLKTLAKLYKLKNRQMFLYYRILVKKISQIWKQKISQKK